MKSIRILFILLAIGSGAVGAAETQLSNMRVTFLYFQMADEPLPVRSMIEGAFRDLNFDNEFERREYLDKQIEPWTTMINDIEQQDEFSKKIRASIGDYDFGSNRFPLKGIHEETYLTLKHPRGVYGPGLAVEIGNSSEFRHLTMEPEAARRLVEEIGGDKKVVVEFSLRPVKSAQKDFSGGGALSMSVNRALVMYAERARILHGEEETELAVMQATSLLEDHSPVERTLTDIDAGMLSNPWKQAWGSKEHFEALFSHYNLDNWEGFSKLAIAQPCMSAFGYVACERMMVKRGQLVSRCFSSMDSRDLCRRLRGLPYTQGEYQR